MRSIYQTRVAVGIFILIFLFAVWYTGFGDFLSLESIKARLEYLEFMVANNYWTSVFVYIGVYILCVAFSLPAASLLTLLGGYLFGIIPGFFYTNIGATCGATGAFLLFRYLIGSAVQTTYKKELKDLNAGLKENEVWYLLFVHFITLIPFFVLNILVALTNVSLWRFMWTTSLGIMPATLIFTFAGKQLRTIESVRDVFSPQVLIAFGLLAFMALLPMLIKRVRRGKS